HRDAMRRKLEAGIANGAADPVAALADARVRQADHRERREPERDVDLDVNGAGLDAEHRRRPQARQHAPLHAKDGATGAAAILPVLARPADLRVQFLPTAADTGNANIFGRHATTRRSRDMLDAFKSLTVGKKHVQQQTTELELLIATARE